jgi:sugar/nucleoside kinase (ribokinase family)
MDFGVKLPTNKPFDVVGFGLNAVDQLAVTPTYPPLGSKVLLTDHKLSVGGQVATAMVALSRLGYKTSYLGKVGAEPSGELQIESLKSEGVDCSRVVRVEGATTQLGLIVIDQSTGERTIFWYRDPRLITRPQELDQQHITSGRILHLDGCDTEAAISAARLARQAGIPVVIDLDTPYPGIEELLPLIDFLIASSEFPETITGVKDRRQSLKMLKEKYGCTFVAMTLGREGALAYHEGQFIQSPAFTDFDIRDTTGAGDAFHGGFDHGLLQGYSVEDTLRIANLIAALNCGKVGARSGLPRLEELNAACAKQQISLDKNRRQ